MPIRAYLHVRCNCQLLLGEGRYTMDARISNISGTTLVLGAGMVVASLLHGATIASVVFALFISWWAIPIHLLCVW